MKQKNIIAIDPDVKKSGVAFLEIATRKLEITNLNFPQLLDYIEHVIKQSQETKLPFIVIVEAGWHNAKSNFHGGKGAAAQRIAKNVGANHQIGKTIIEWCNHKGIEVIEQRPLRKIWKGQGGKITHQELSSFTNIIGRTNQDARDAALLAWNYAGLPIKIKK